MKLNIVKDSKGKIIAGCEICSDPEIVSVRPVLEDGQTVEEIDAPDDCFEHIDELCGGWEKPNSAN